jgi:capsular exopolysaccharide synthesis family protein
MEPLKQAIEKARCEREAVPRRPEATFTRHPRIRETVVQQPIEYTKTQHVAPDAETLENHRIFLNSTRDPLSHAYKTLRTQVRQRLTSKGWNTLAITSALEGEGKSVIAANLAIGLARDVNHTVLLADLDLRRPAVHKCFGIEPQRGLSDYLVEGGDVSDLFINPGVDRLVLLPGHDSIEHSSEALSSPRMVHLLGEIKNRYKDRIIVLDMPPLLSTDDAIAFAPYVDACLLVVEADKTRKHEIAQAMHLLKRTHLLGTVLNKSREPGHSYYY